MHEILDWCAAAPSELARQAAEALARGGLIALPSEVGYVLAADPASLTNPARPDRIPDSLATTRLDGYFDPSDFFARMDAAPIDHVLARRLWPGPIGWIDDDLPFAAWVPSHTALAAVLGHYRVPLALFELCSSSPIELSAFGDRLDLAISDATPRSGCVTLLRPSGSGFRIVRPGLIGEEEIQQRLARKIVFLCTGNTCRSPMAEAMFKQGLAQKLGCEIAELSGQGYSICSAGLSASVNDPAAADSVDVLSEFGLDLSNHRSQPATFDLIAQADDVIVMTRAHLQSLLGRYPAINGSLRLLCGAEGDLNDPIGRGPDIYRRCATLVQHHVERLICEMGLS